MFVINGLALRHLLVKERQRYLAGADDRHQLFKLGHLSRVGRLVPQHPHMMGEPPTVYVVRPFTKEIEHLRKGQGHKKVIGGRGVGNGEENRRFPIPDAVKLHLVIGHNLPKLGGNSDR